MEEHEKAWNSTTEGGRLFMVIICPIGWGMAQRGESKHKERFVQHQRNARPPNKGELTSSTGCSPSDSSSCGIQDRPPSTQLPAETFGQNCSKTVQSSPLRFPPA